MYIIREFYANELEAINDRAMIIGVCVPFSTSTINSYYGMREVNIWEYKAYLENIDYEGVLGTLTLGVV